MLAWRFRASLRRTRFHVTRVVPAVTGQHDLPARAGWPEHLLGLDDGAVCERDRLAALECAACRPVRHVEGGGRVDVETPGALRLDECVPDRRHAVIDRERAQLVSILLEDRSGLELDGVDRICEAAEDAPRCSGSASTV